MKKEITKLLAEMLIYIFGFGFVEIIMKYYDTRTQFIVYTIIGIIGFILYYK